MQAMTKTCHEVGKIILNTAVILTSSVLIGYLALCLILYLPENRMKEHIVQSMPMITSEFENSDVIMGYAATLTGNFTDCIMLENAVYSGGG